ncbi:putative Tetratricopeptide repeat protein 28 [Zopfia rhizophila CBS 207.26]|uniref:Putative Tetratricopeptide repeat protein 28 n=1 Tax=Zopfia rhizophila CBS 207.26 TaxID=1314779 RepID=A0A6A6EJ99_9PEZI|nr:putative Tetratricopeptide repeat protein 28 [Zopfia rhizophila CBS 207.26]
MAFLHSAEKFFWGEAAHQQSYTNGLETSLILARSYLREVQSQIEIHDWGEGVEEKARSTLQVRNRQKLLSLLEKGLASIFKAISGKLELRKKLIGMPPMQALENNRLFYFSDMEELYWTHMGLEMDKVRVLGNPIGLWQAMQQWKAICLVDLLSQGLEESPTPEDDLVTAERPNAGHPTTAEKIKHVNQLLKDVTTPLTFNEGSIWELADHAERHLGPDKSIIFVDWVRHHDTLFLAAFNGTTGVLITRVVEMDYSAIETWVRENLGAASLHEGRVARKRLNRASMLEQLQPLLEPLDGFIKEGDLLSHSPAGILHSAAGRFANHSITSGRHVTHASFVRNSDGVNLLHYHGHAFLDASERKDRALVLEDGLLTVMDLFELRLDAALVVLLACASGEEDVAPNDDTLGLLSAFLYAGAASVLATLWPTQTADARDFAERFYERAFGAPNAAEICLAKIVQEVIVEMWEEWDEDDPYHWAQFQLRK